MGGIFISYRREDSADITGRIADHLATRYGKPAVFKDVDNIPYGAAFPAFIRQQLAACSVCLVVIGPRWLAPGPDGRRRLDDPGDFVRLEIETALALGRVVVPVLVNGATMPPPGWLPPSLARLHYVNAALVRLDPDFTTDVRRLCEVTDRFVPPQVSLAAPYFAPSGPYAAPPKPPRQPLSPKQRRRRRIALIAAAVVALLVAGGFWRFNSPVGAMQAYLQAFYADDVDAAYALYCPEVQAVYSKSQQQSAMASVDAHATNVDLSHVRYTVVDEGLTTAQLRIGGYLTYTDAATGNSGTLTFYDNATDVLNLHAQGLGWCIASGFGSPGALR
jgi:hypothetical protein